jgi:hypothetical protein
MLVKQPAEYPEPEQDNNSREGLLPQQARNENALPGAPPPQTVVLLCPLSGEVCHLKWWLTKYIADNVDILHMDAEMGNAERTEMQLKIQDA